MRPIDANNYRKKLEMLKNMEHFSGITALNLAIAALDEEPTVTEKDMKNHNFSGKIGKF